MKTIIAMLATLSLIGVISGGGLAMLSSWADPLIAANKKADTERAIFLVQPTAKSYEPVKEVAFELYRVFDDTKNSLGYALPWEGNGFQGKVRMMVGVSADLNTITAIEVLDQVETPGLGTKVTEEPFRKQFKGLVAVPQVDWIKGVPPTKKNEIQTITGATISSKAIVAIVNDGLVHLRKDLTQGGVQ
ncbi:MAG: FMN-binding protein [Bacteroidetes bacterium]|nr:FMN-binding protein [Bacteroidota bacterium]